MAPADDVGGTDHGPVRNVSPRLDATATSLVGRTAAAGSLFVAGGCGSTTDGAAASRLVGPMQLAGQLREERSQLPGTARANPQ
jgi:hypothetical protein